MLNNLEPNQTHNNKTIIKSKIKKLKIITNTIKTNSKI